MLGNLKEYELIITSASLYSLIPQYHIKGRNKIMLLFKSAESNLMKYETAKWCDELSFTCQ